MTAINTSNPAVPVLVPSPSAANAGSGAALISALLGADAANYAAASAAQAAANAAVQAASAASALAAGKITAAQASALIAAAVAAISAPATPSLASVLQGGPSAGGSPITDVSSVVVTGAVTSESIVAAGNWYLVNPSGQTVLNLNGSNNPFWLVKVEFGADVEATKDLYVDGTLRLTGGITNQYNNPVYVYNTNGRGVVLGDSATAQTGNVIDMALPTVFRSTVALSTLNDLSSVAQAGTLGYYNGCLYYSNGTAWRRSSGTYTGVAF